jgi:hypothetical protein
LVPPDPVGVFSHKIKAIVGCDTAN